MKKTLLLILLLFISTNVYASATEKEEVKLLKCETASTAWVSKDNHKMVIRLLAYDEKDTSLNNTISKFTCDTLKGATKIEIAYDTESDTKDKYNRDWVWVYVDDQLLQNLLIEKGYGEVNNAKASFEHTEMLCVSEKYAVKEKAGIWALDTEAEDYCKSGIEIKTTKKAKKKKTATKKKKEESPIKFIIFCAGGILILLVALWSGRKHEKE